MKTRTVNFSLFWLLLGTYAGCSWLLVWGNLQAQRLQSEHEARVQARKQQWASEEAARQVAAHEQALEIQHRREREMALVLGDPTKLPACNPDLDLRQMLEQSALVCAPAGTKVTVQVERFTDFDVLVELPEPLTKNQMADLGRCLLRGNGVYVQSIRFVHARKVLAQLDRRAIEFVPDWAATTTAAVAQLLLDPEMEAATTRNETSLTAVRESEELTGDQKRLIDFQQAYDRAWLTNYAKFTNVIWILETAVRLSSVTAPNHLDLRLKSLDAADRLIQETSAFFSPENSTYEKLLAEAGFDDLVVRILKRGQAERAAQEQPHFTRLFAAAQDSVQQTRALLLEMKSHWGAWKPIPGGRQLSFTSQAAADAYARAGAQVERSQSALAGTLKAWSDWRQQQAKK